MMRLQSSSTRTLRPRRGVTLVEMLVTLAVLLIMMTAIVQIFAAATGTLSASRAYQELDAGLRRLDGVIRTDFNGVTAKLTPPNDPKDNRGYFEVGENAFADLQGEDGDDYVRFTTKAPADKPFTGRYWPNSGVLSNPIEITSQFAEVIYFLRNGNLYRRVFLIVPERQKSSMSMINNVNATYATGFKPNQLNANPVSWQGMNDVSARPSATGSGIVLNTLGDLTNRENRAFAPRFANDFVSLDYNPANGQYNVSAGYDQYPEDLNSFVANMTDTPGDGVPDFYPSLYFGVFSPLTVGNAPLVYEGGVLTGSGTRPPRTGATFNTMAFPYVFPGAYSHPDYITRGMGWLHSPNPIFSNSSTQLTYLRFLNHNPIDLGDNLPRPTTGGNGNTFGGLQTWWGFPTWRETLSFNWTDPTHPINVSPYAQAPGLTPRSTINTTTGAVFDDANLLPPMAYNTSNNEPAAVFNLMRPVPQPYADGLGGTSQFMDLGSSLWAASWEDDLIMTGVRSFDIKVLDTALGDYVDLGWGDDVRSTAILNPPAGSYLNQNTERIATDPYLAIDINGGTFDLLGQTFAHEGRMPPRVLDHRLDAQFPNPTYFGTLTPEYPAFANYSSNVGDNSLNVVRLRRVWDSWSTDYSTAPAKGFNPVTKSPIGPPFSPPVYPSYPPPYPAPLRGIQIQIRVQDPSGKYVKSLTIRQDFTEKL